ncbi:hypothetical protein BKA70DRAFT_1238456 [Coprinopsis sp. MPI-PUGE-AT-0042]|nr:hypothetical protein BKA70DRAFT_1238456 [Coprinopsis sp. MPI-PUGE-AT-0042]
MASYLMFYQPGVQVFIVSVSFKVDLDHSPLEHVTRNLGPVSGFGLERRIPAPMTVVGKIVPGCVVIRRMSPISVWTMNGKWKAAANTMRHITLYALQAGRLINSQVGTTEPVTLLYAQDFDGRSDLKEVKAEVRYHMRCAFFGTDCEEVQMVPVPVHAGYEEDTMACDLYHRFYVNTLNPCHNRVIRFEDFTIDVGSWPRESNKSSKYVVVYGNGVGFSGSASLTWYPEFWADTVETRATLRPPPRYAAADHRQGLISPTHLRRSDRIRHAKKLISLVFTIPELFLRVISQLDWHDLMRIAKVSKHGQACVRVQISDRIRYLLDRWIPAIHMQDFLNALNRSWCGCGWVGCPQAFQFYIASGESCTRWIGPMTSTSLLLPEGRQSAGAFFQSIGYDTWLSEEVRMPLSWLRFWQGARVTCVEKTDNTWGCGLHNEPFIPRRPSSHIILYPSNKQWEGVGMYGTGLSAVALGSTVDLELRFDPDSHVTSAFPELGKTASLLISVSPAGGGSGKRANIVLDLYIGSTGPSWMTLFDLALYRRLWLWASVSTPDPNFEYIHSS